MSDEPSAQNAGTENDSFPQPLQSVIEALGRLKFGAIQLTVHEGKLVQVDVTERKRFAN